MMDPTLSSEATRVLPGPRVWPLIGNPGLARGLLPFLESSWARYGDTFKVKVLGFEAMVLTDPADIQHVLLTNRSNYYKGRIYDILRLLVGDSLVTFEGDQWKDRRALMQPAFHRKSLELLSTKMVQSGATFFDRLAKRVQGGDSIVNMHQEMIKLTLAVVIEALFGSGLLEESAIPYAALGSALELLGSRLNSLQLPEWVPSPSNYRFRQNKRALDANVMQIIEAARARADEAGVQSTLLGMLLASRDEHGKPLSDEELRNEVLTLFLAGHETTAVTLTWVFALLSEEPAVMAQMREEIRGVLGGRDPSFEDIPRLVYTRQVIDETLRLRSPATMLLRNAYAADEVAGYDVPAGGALLPFVWGAHRHPDHWSEPLRFDPERFAPGAHKGRHACSYLPFAAGPRVCIGNSFALIESVLLLAQFFTRFDAKIESCADVVPVALGAVRPSKPVRVRLQLRAAS